MCGVIARWGAPSPLDALRGPLEAGLAALARRGPDGRGTWIDPAAGVALGHARLAVIDLDGGAQPVTNEDGSIIAVVNGELYDFEARRGELEAAGHRFHTRGDSELLIHLYEERGLACLDELRGELAFVLWDGRARRLIAARDRFGIKPLLYTRRGDELYLASNAKALFAAGVAAEWDLDGIYGALAHQYVAPSHTLFRGVCELQPGHYLVADAGGVRTGGYGTLVYPTSYADAGEDEVIAEIRAALEEAVATRLRADVPIAAYLSGGLDSSLVVALAARRAPIATFGIAFEHAPYDEHRDAAAFARELGVDFHPVVVSQDAILEHLPDAVEQSEGLCINGQLSAKYLLARAVRAAGYRVVLAGEGADEVFYGYAHLVRDFIGDSFPAPAAQAGIMLPLGDPGELPSWLAAKREVGQRMLPLLSPDARAAVSRDPSAQLLAAVGADPDWHPVDRAVHAWSKLALARYILRTLGDGTEMAFSIEGRLPFLDPHVWRAARRAPPALHLQGGTAKRLLRAAARDILPERIAMREKQPLLAPPIAQLTSARSRDLIRDVVRGPALHALPWFDRDATIAWVDALATATPDAARASEPLLMTILSACALHQRLHLGVPA